MTSKKAILPKPMVALLLTLVSVWTSSAALAESYPNKPVSIIVPVAAGTGADVIARVLADSLSQRWKQQVLIVNRPGASGAVAAQAAALSPADGYTLYMAVSSAFAVIPETKTKWPVSLETDFATIGLISDQPMIVAVTPSLGINTLAEFIDLVKRRPGEILYGAPRLSVPHLTGAYLNARAGIEMRYIPTQGAAKVMQDILNGNLHVIVDSVPGSAGALRNGAVKALVFTGDQRLNTFPDLPLASETLPDFNVKGWFVLMAPVQTQEPLVAQIREDLRETLNDPALRKRYEDTGTFPRPSSIEQTMAYIKAEQDRWRPIVRQIGGGAE
jgi:tripartite-type tricarboxylate transporter receptor subunit TctC